MCDCDGPPDLVFDTVASEEICARCGVVVETVLHDGRDWAFHEHGDGSRVGTPGSSLGTFVDRVPGVSQRVLGMATSPDDAHRKPLRDMCSRANIAGVVHAAAERMYEDYVAAMAPSGRSRQATLAACLFFACRLERADRELRTIAAAAGVRVQTLNATAKAVKDYLLGSEYAPLVASRGAGGVDPMVGVFIGKLDVDSATRKRLWRETGRVLESTDALNSGKKPRTVVAAAMHAAAMALGVAVPKKDIAAAAGVCAQTI